MPLSKKRNKERMKVKRATCVQPKIVIGVDLGFKPPNPVVQPIPNCPDGRYRATE